MDRFVYLGAQGSSNGSSWANAHTDMRTALAAMNGGDTLWVAHDQATMLAFAQSKAGQDLRRKFSDPGLFTNPQAGGAT